MFIDKVTYEYKNNKLIKINYYDRAINPKLTPYREVIYKYDTTDKLIEISDTDLNIDEDSKTVKTFRYDINNNLVLEQETNNLGITETKYYYDKINNLTQKIAVKNGETIWEERFVLNYNNMGLLVSSKRFENNRITIHDFEYDESENLTKETIKYDNETHIKEYDSNGLVKAITRINNGLVFQQQNINYHVNKREKIRKTLFFTSDGIVGNSFLLEFDENGNIIKNERVVLDSLISDKIILTDENGNWTEKSTVDYGIIKRKILYH